MNTDSISKQIFKRMDDSTRGTIYTNSDFFDLGNTDAIRKSLSRLVELKQISRLIDGYYTIPYYSEIIGECTYPTANQLAEKIAEKYSWTISPTGENALNQVGLSTQISVVCEYVSDGPYREYDYFDKTIKFKHTSNRNITKHSKSLSILIQAIKYKGENNISKDDIKIMSKFSKKYITENYLLNARSLPAWIYTVLKNIEEEKND